MASQNTKFDLLFWALGLVLLAISVAQYYLIEQSVLLRFVVLLVLIGLAIFAWSRTQKGQQGWALWQEALIELRKVIWPTRKETTQTTMVVLMVVAVAGVFLWAADAIFLKCVGWLMGHT